MTDAILHSQLTSPLYASAAMRSIMSDRARLQRMLDFEAALARAEAAVGVITATGAVDIAEACNAERYNVNSLVEAAIPSGNIVLAMVNALTLDVARRNMNAAGFVHWGASSQDVIDTALVLELRAAIDALLIDLDIGIKGFTALAGRHRRTLTVARTLMQQALPMPFGLRLAGYAAALARSRDRLTRLRREALALQFGGAAGTLAALGEHGFAVAERLAALLDLPLPDAPWHSHRDRLAEIAAAFGILAGTCGKIARDVALMMQTELGEASEPEAPGRGVSSTLPHKRDPSGAAAALSAATVAPNLVATIFAAQVQELERGLGGMQTEWTAFPTLALVTSGALDAVAQIAEGLEVDVDRMRANLDQSGGRIMTEAIAFALAEKIGRVEAHRLMQELCQRADKEKRPLKEVLFGDLRIKQHFRGPEIEKLFIPLTYQGSAQLFIERLVVASQTRAPRRSEPRMDVKLPTAPQLQPVAEAAPQQASPPPEPPPAPRIEPPHAVSAADRFQSVEPHPMAASAGDESAQPAQSAEAFFAHDAADAEPPMATAGPAEPEAEISPPAPADESAPAAEPAHKPELPPADEDAPGAFMDVLSRAEAEARAAELAENKPKPS
jgi:3-carboxy-cis,cis-muconate cycloisomerase